MRKRDTIATLLGIMLLLLSLSVVSSVVASSSQVSAYRFDAKGGIPGPPAKGDTTPPVVSILSPSDGATVNGIVTISADVTDDVGIGVVEYGIDSGGWTPMSNVGGSTYQADWDSASVYDGGHAITVRATDTSDNEGTNSITVTTSNGVAPPPPTIEYELWIEIDYMAGHEPNQTILAYIHGYYLDRGINVTFYVDDLVVDPTPDTKVTDDDFASIETSSNDHDFGYYSKWKWVLYGTAVEGQPTVVGYCWVVINRATKDMVAGNYIFIADETADNWAISVGVEAYGAEAVVLMHEMGHSIGIGKYHPAFGEIYDSDPGSVMSYLTKANAGLYGAWYYSDEYWATRNMGYYAV